MAVNAAPRVEIDASPHASDAAGGGQVRLALINGFELSRNGQMLCLGLGAQRLIAFLALRDRPIQRLYVAGTMWPEASEARAAANLRSSLWRVNRLNCPVIESTGSLLRLAQAVFVDFQRIASLARQVTDGTASLENPQLDSIAAYGDLLPDWYDADWVVVERERFRQLQLHAMELLCSRFIEAGMFARAVQAGMAAVHAEPLRESAHRVLIRAHLAEGNHVEAIRQYGTYRRLLLNELGLVPSVQMEELVRSVRSDNAPVTRGA